MFWWFIYRAVKLRLLHYCIMFNLGGHRSFRYRNVIGFNLMQIFRFLFDREYNFALFYEALPSHTYDDILCRRHYNFEKMFL